MTGDAKFISKDSVEDALRPLVHALHEQLLNTGLVTLEQWNAEIAPHLKGVASALEESPIHARTFRVHESIFPPVPRPGIDEIIAYALDESLEPRNRLQGVCARLRAWAPRSENGWIAVTERLPTELRDQIICLAFTPTDSDGDASVPGAFAASYGDGEWTSRMDTGCWEPGDVTHWMPFPGGPK